MIPYILTNDSLTVIIDGKSLTMNRDNPSFRSATQALQDEDYEKVEQMFDIPKAVVNFVEGNVSVSDGVLTYTIPPARGFLVPAPQRELWSTKPPTYTMLPTYTMPPPLELHNANTPGSGSCLRSVKFS